MNCCSPNGQLVAVSQRLEMHEHDLFMKHVYNRLVIDQETHYDPRSTGPGRIERLCVAQI